MIEQGTGEEVTTDLYLVLCYSCKLSNPDLEIMTIGMCLDYIQEYIEQQKPPKQRRRNATQSDMNNF